MRPCGVLICLAKYTADYSRLRGRPSHRRLSSSDPSTTPVTGATCIVVVTVTRPGPAEPVSRSRLSTGVIHRRPLFHVKPLVEAGGSLWMTGGRLQQ
jgi:hypothetical protein